MSRGMTGGGGGGRVYGGGQPIPVRGGPSAPTPTSAAAAAAAAATGHLNFGAISSASSAQRADFTGGGGGGGATVPAGGAGQYGGFGSAPEAGGWGSGLARAVLYPLHAVAGGSSATPASAAAAAAATATGGASSYDPHLSNFPLLPRFRGGATEGDRLYPVPFGSDARGPTPRIAPAAAIRASEVRAQQNLSSLLNSPAFAADELEPPPLYIAPLPTQYNEPTQAVVALIQQYSKRADIAGEYLVYTSHHGPWTKPRDPHGRDSATGTAAERHAQQQLASCIRLVPERYFAPDFSVAQEALMFYEAQLAAAAAEAEDEDAADAAKNNGNGNALAPSSASAVTKSPASSSASSFYSSFSPSAPARAGGAPQTATDSTYFKAAWAAAHAPAPYSADAIGIVPGVVGAVLVTPAKAAASLYKLFTKVTGGSTRSPTAVATSHQRSMGFSPITRKHGGSWSANGSASPAATAEDLNALQLQMRLASYLDLVELTLMQLVGSKSKAFFASLATIQLLDGEVKGALAIVARLRENMRVMSQRLVNASLSVVARERQLRNALQLQSMLDIVASVAKTQSTVKLLLATSEFSSAIGLVHSTLALVKSPEFRRIKCLAQMEIKLKENLKLIDMLMMAEFVAITLPEVPSAPSTPTKSAAASPPPPLTTAEGKASLHATVALSEDDRERLVSLVQTLASFGTLLPTLLKYASQLREHTTEQVALFWQEEMLAVQPSPPPTTSHSRRGSALTNSSPAQTLPQSTSTPNLAAIAASASSAPASTPPSAGAAASSNSSSFMSSLIPNALKRTGPTGAPVATLISSAAATTEVDSASTVPTTSPPAFAPTPSPPTQSDPAVLDATTQAFIASLPHPQFLQLQARLHTRLCRIVYRAQSVREIVLEAVASASPAGSASANGNAVGGASITRLRSEFRDLFQALLARSSASPARSSSAGNDDASQGVVEARCVSLLEPRLQAHTRLDVYEMKDLFDATMDFVRDMEEIGSSGGSTGAADSQERRDKFVCLELRKVTLAHEKAFLGAIHAKLVHELTTSMERDTWERVDVPRAVQVLIDSGFMQRPHGLRITGATASHTPAAADLDDTDEPATAATYLFIEQDGPAAEGDDTSVASSPVYAKYALTSSVLTLLRLLSFYCECALHLKGVSNDVLKSVVHLLTLFTSRSMQLILGAGAVQVNPEVKVITSKHLALTSQCLSLIQAQVPPLRRLLHQCFPEKHHAQLAKDTQRVAVDYGDHVKELFTKLESMAMEVCDSTCKSTVHWIKREEEIAQLQAQATAAGGASSSPSVTNDLPTLFKLSSRLLTQTDALYNVVSEVLQPAQRDALLRRISLGYAERFHRYFNSSAAGCVVTSSLVCASTRTKLSKRMDATLDKFKGWLTPQDWQDMKQRLAPFGYIAIANATTPVTAPPTATSKLTPPAAVAAQSAASSPSPASLSPAPSSELP